MVILCLIDGGDNAFLFSLYHKIAESARGCEANHAKGVSVCAKRNIIDAKHHIIAKHIICTKCNLVHLCPPCGGMMLS